MYFGPLRSVFRSEGERAAWLLLCAYLCWLEGNKVGEISCVFYACEAIKH
jgi:hypothetical protein